MNQNIQVGADLHSGDGGYSVGTQEKYEEFVKMRNQPTSIIITRKQFERLQEVFKMYDSVDQIVWSEVSTSGIGPTVTIEFDPKQSIKMDITDVDSW
jgi:hypothetical protein